MKALAEMSVAELAQALTKPSGLMPPGERELMRRCATVRAFDEELVDAVLRPGVPAPAPSFQEIAVHRYTESLPGKPPTYRVRSSFRQELFETWWDKGDAPTSIPHALRELSAQLAEYYAARGNNLERLYHLAAADQQAAIGLLTQLFDDAVARYDLPTCHDIIRALEERRLPLGPELAAALRLQRSRQDALQLWSPDYYETAVYYERDVTRRLVKDLWKDSEPWVLHLFARGGLGKTTFMRYLTSRVCLPRGIPCARIDLDYGPHRSATISEPWRMWLAIAEQLDRQIEDKPFHEVRTEYAGALASTEPLPLVNQNDAVGRVTRTLARLCQKRKLLLIFDTLERLRDDRSDGRTLYQQLRELRYNPNGKVRSPGLRVLLGGRFNLCEHIALPNNARPPDRPTAFAEVLGDESREVELQPFSDDEAGTYLRAQRGLTDPALVAVIVEKGQGNPFNLSLLADAVLADPTLTADKIARYDNPSQVYLIERVVERIADCRLRRLLRYGVVPRLLTFDFLEKVIAPYLKASLAGSTEADNTARDELHDEIRNQDPFYCEEDPSQELDLVSMWANLYPYNAQYSWVSSSREVPNALTFHTDVIGPMRALLRKHPVFRLLNEDAARYYHELSLSDQAGRHLWLAEEIFHRYQIGDPTVGDYWRKLVDDPLESRKVVQSLVDEVLSGKGTVEPLEEGGPPLPVSDQVRARAGFWQARFGLDVEGDPGEEAWSVVRDCLSDSATSRDGGAVAAGESEYLEARLQLHERQTEKALAICETGLSHPADVRNEIELRLLRGELLRRLDRPAADEEYRQAARLAEGADVPGSRAAHVRLAETLEILERFEEALAERDLLVAAALEDDDLVAAADSAAQKVQDLILMGQEGAAVQAGQESLARLEKAASSVSPALAAAVLGQIRAEIELAQSMPEIAVTRIDAGFPSNWPSELPDVGHWGKVETSLRARAAAAMLSASLAGGKAEQLMSSWAPGTWLAHETLLGTARLYSVTFGDNSSAGRYVALAEAVEQTTDLIDVASARRAREVTAAWLARGGGSSSPAPKAEAPPSLAVQAAVLLDPASPRVVDALLAVKPSSRRLALLHEMRELDPKLELRPAAEAVLASLEREPAEGQDIALYNMRLASAVELAGRDQEVASLIDAAVRGASKPVRLALLRRIYRTADVVGWNPEQLKAVEFPPGSDAMWSLAPELACFTLLEHANRLFHGLQDQKSARQLIEQAKALPVDAALQRMLDEFEARLDEGKPEAAAQMKRIRITPGGSSGQAAPSSSSEGKALGLGGAPDEGPLRLHLRPSLGSQGWDTSYGLEQGGVDRTSELPSTQYAPGNMQWQGRRQSAPGSLDQLTTLTDTEARTLLAEDLAADWSNLGRDLGRAVLGPEVLRWLAEDSPVLDIVWEPESLRLAWLPWELVCREKSGVPLAVELELRYLYRSGQQRGLSSRSGQTSPSVLILGPSETVVAYTTRGIGRGLDLRRFYKGAGYEVRDEPVPDVESLSGMTAGLRPRIVHIQAGIRERRGQLVLDFAGETSLEYGDSKSMFQQSREAESFALQKGVERRQLSPRELAFALSRAGASPLVILAPPTPPDEAEAARQLLLRNAFCSELLAAGSVSAVLGTGLLTDSRASQVLEALSAGLGNGRRVGEVAQDMRLGRDGYWRGSSDLWNALGPLSTALFTADPEQRFGVKEEP